MAYETGTATNEHDLLDKLRTFLVSAGWTQNYWAAEGDGYRLHVNKNNVYANFRSTAATKVFSVPQSFAFKGIGYNLSTGYNSSNSWELQPGSIVDSVHHTYSTGNVLGIPSSVLSYYFFANGDCFDVFAETSSNYFNSLHGGELTKFGSYTGGMYFTATRTTADYSPLGGTPWIVDHLPFTNQESNYGVTGVLFESSWYSNNNPFYSGYLMNPFSGKTFTQTIAREAGMVTSLLAAPPTSEGSTVLLPLYYAAYQNPYYYPLGYVPYARICRGEYVANGQEVILGSDTWKLFQTTAIGTARIALAIKKVV